MLDYNSIYDTGKIDEGEVTAVIEIPKWSSLKIEWNRKTKAFELDRIEPSIFAKPVNYGFIPKTLDEDGDELDVLLITNDPIPTGVVVNAKIVAILNFEDDGEMDHKVVCVPSDDRNTGNAVSDLSDLHEQWKLKIEHHFNHYKDLKKPGTTKVLGWGDTAEAVKIIKECQDRFNKL